MADDVLTKDKERGLTQVNYQRKNARLAAAVLAAAMMAAPVCALAAETSAHVPGSQSAQEATRKIMPFGKTHAFRGVSVSQSWLRQVRLGGVLLNIRLHTPMGEEITFREKLALSESGDRSVCLYLMASSASEVITLQLDQPAVDALHRLGVSQIVVADKERNIRADYQLSELEAVRQALGLEELEQLCVSGENAPVTVVSVDGIRRQVNP